MKFLFNHEERGQYSAEIEDIVIHGLDTRDYPDFCDAFICDAKIEGRQATDEELDQMNDDGDFRYEQVMESVY